MGGLKRRRQGCRSSDVRIGAVPEPIWVECGGTEPCDSALSLENWGPHSRREVLSGAEVGDAIDLLSEANETRLMQYATWQAGGLSEEPDDLVQEAKVRAIAGDRKCPAGADIVVFLYGVIRSLASAARKRGGSVRFVPLVDESGEEPADPARLAAQIEVREAILAVFEGRPDWLLIVRLQIEGFRGAEIMDRTGLSRSALDTAQKGIRRRWGRALRRGLL